MQTTLVLTLTVSAMLLNPTIAGYFMFGFLTIKAIEATTG